MSRYTKEQRERLDQDAQQQRDWYRRYLRGTLDTCPIVGRREAWWRATPERWVWLNELSREYLTLPQLKKAVKKEGISSKPLYRKKYPKHSDWPSDPWCYYGDEWISWRDLFGRKELKFLTLPQLKRAVKKEGISIHTAYQKESPRHSDWSSDPNRYYGDEWISWRDLFGKKKYLTLPQLKKAVKKAGISGHPAYRKKYSKHSDWPSAPHIHYGDEWISWRDLFGRKELKFLTLPQLKKAVKKEGICNQSAYRKENPKHSDWPSHPDRYSEWISWYDLFGKRRGK